MTTAFRSGEGKQFTTGIAGNCTMPHYSRVFAFISVSERWLSLQCVVPLIVTGWIITQFTHVSLRSENYVCFDVEVWAVRIAMLNLRPSQFSCIRVIVFSKVNNILPSWSCSDTCLLNLLTALNSPFLRVKWSAHLKLVWYFNISYSGRLLNSRFVTSTCANVRYCNWNCSFHFLPAFSGFHKVSRYSECFSSPPIMTGLWRGGWS